MGSTGEEQLLKSALQQTVCKDAIEVWSSVLNLRKEEEGDGLKQWSDAFKDLNSKGGWGQRGRFTNSIHDISKCQVLKLWKYCLHGGCSTA